MNLVVAQTRVPNQVSDFTLCTYSDQTKSIDEARRLTRTFLRALLKITSAVNVRLLEDREKLVVAIASNAI